MDFHDPKILKPSKPPSIDWHWLALRPRPKDFPQAVPPSKVITVSVWWKRYVGGWKRPSISSIYSVYLRVWSGAPGFGPVHTWDVTQKFSQTPSSNQPKSILQAQNFHGELGVQILHPSILYPGIHPRPAADPPWCCMLPSLPELCELPRSWKS